MQPDTRYVLSTGDVSIAYQVVGDGPKDLVLAPGWIFNLEVVWEHPSFETFVRRLIRNFRVILFDKRGTGLSDRNAARSTLEERMDDVRAVMDAAGSGHAAVMGWSEGANIGALFAATYPERVEGLVLYGGGARYLQAPDYPIGMGPQFMDFAREVLREHWGEGMSAYLAVPSRAQDPNFRRWFGRYERLSVSPGQGIAMLDLNMGIDTTDILKTIKVPTLVLHNARDIFVPVSSAATSPIELPMRSW